MLKRIVVFMLVVAMSLSLVACGGSSLDQMEQSQQESTPQFTERELEFIDKIEHGMILMYDALKGVQYGVAVEEINITDSEWSASGIAWEWEGTSSNVVRSGGTFTVSGGISDEGGPLFVVNDMVIEF